MSAFETVDFETTRLVLDLKLLLNGTPNHDRIILRAITALEDLEKELEVCRKDVQDCELALMREREGE